MLICFEGEDTYVLHVLRGGRYVCLYVLRGKIRMCTCVERGGGGRGGGEVDMYAYVFRRQICMRICVERR